MKRLSVVLALLALLTGIILPWSVRAKPIVQTATGNSKAVVGTGSAIQAAKDGEGEEEDKDYPRERADAFYLPRIAGDQPLTVPEAAQLRDKAAQAALAQRLAPPSATRAAPAALSGAWTAQGPNPIVQEARAANAGLIAVSGRITALAMTKSGNIFLGAAQGGLWKWDAANSQWNPIDANFPTLAIGAIAVAPSNQNVIYVGTGEGSLSGDSYFGSGVMRSTDGGATFNRVDNGFFSQVSISKIAVDPTKSNHLYVATVRGVGGKFRTAPPNPSKYGILESQDGGATWIERFVTTDRTRGAVDLVIDPQFNGTTNRVMIASILGEGLVRSTDGGQTWTSSMNGLPVDADYSKAPTRIALGISRPAAAATATVYAGFEWYDTTGEYHPSTIWKSTDGGVTWAETNTDVVSGYCGVDEDNRQCTYDNEIGVDPANPNIVYALGWFNYSTGTGGVYRSLDGGATWRDLGYGQHPDFHAIAIQPNAPEKIVIGNDGGAWFSADRGGRLEATSPITDVTWVDLNGTINPDGSVVGTGLQITQFTSIGQHPTNNRLYGGAQDNGTSRKRNTPTTDVWFDFASGDGGQVLVDPVDPNYVYGTYYGISPYRFSNGMSNFNTNQPITTGINPRDRSEFYIPFEIDPDASSHLLLGTYRVYRTDDRGDKWRPISGDLTSGCTGQAPNGARSCTITTIGLTAGSSAVYAGTGEGYIQLATNTDVLTPTWKRIDNATLPKRPVADITVDGSNYRVAYVAFNGYNAATPSKTGHVFKTTDAGQTWQNISGNLPDVPANSLVIDPTNPNTLYAGTDIGPYITTNGGGTWSQLGTNFPIVAVHQVDYNAFTHRLAAATHGRGAWTTSDTGVTPALSVRAADAGTPVGPNSDLTYTITVKNHGNGGATGVAIEAPMPANTTFVSATDGGTLVNGKVTWGSLTVPAAAKTTPADAGSGLTYGETTRSFTVRIADTATTGSVITSSDITVASNEAATITSSPYPVTLAPANAVRLTPSAQADGTRSGQVITYTFTLDNRGYTTDTYNLAVSGNAWPTTIYNADFTTPISDVVAIAPGVKAIFGVRVAIPANAPNGTKDGATVVVTSTGNPAVKASATISTTAVTFDVLLVDQDGNAPDVLSSYTAALDSSGRSYNVWDLTENPVLPVNYVKAHKAVIWFTGTSYPGPITPYEPVLTQFLQNGGRLFMSGWDLLDQAAGTTDFVRNYLHIAWDGSEDQNDKNTITVTGVTTNTLTAGLGDLPLDPTVLFPDGGNYSDWVTPIAPAIPAFMDKEAGQIDGLTVDTDGYKVVFLAFPFEALGTAADRATVMQRTLTFFDVGSSTPVTPTPTPVPGGSPQNRFYLPFVGQ